jgi:hypothetical protein
MMIYPGPKDQAQSELRKIESFILKTRDPNIPMGPEEALEQINDLLGVSFLVEENNKLKAIASYKTASKDDFDALEAENAKLKECACPYQISYSLDGSFKEKIFACKTMDDKYKKVLEFNIILKAVNAKLKEEKDNAYTERNKLVAFISKLYPSHLARHLEDPNWDADWMNIVFIDTPAGQLSWHIHDSELSLFDHIEYGENNWDGHTTEEKYDRLQNEKLSIQCRNLFSEKIRFKSTVEKIKELLDEDNEHYSYILNEITDLVNKSLTYQYMQQF